MDLLLCRIHVSKGDQFSLPFGDFDAYKNMSCGDVLHEAIMSRPNLTSRSKLFWSIANVEEIDERSLFFHMGYEKLKKEGTKDDEGNFTEEERIVAPHTRAIIDWNFEICAIEPCSELGIKLDLPYRLSELLNNSVVAKRNGAVFTVSPIDNPEEFIRWVNDSFSVLMFEFTFSKPNFIDIEEDFQKPLQAMAKCINGENNRVTFKNGEGLGKGNLVDLGRAVIATGHKVTAKCKASIDAPVETRKSSGSPVLLEVYSLENKEGKEEAINIIRLKYEEIRYGKKHAGGKS